MVGFLILSILLYLVSLAGAILSYVLSSLSVYTIAKRRMISNPWLAWIPFANYWTIGAIADDYDARMGIKRKWRVILLTLSLVFLGTFLLIYITIFAVGFSLALKYQYVNTVTPDFIGFMIMIYIMILVVMLVALAFTACSYICTFKLFESTVPQKAVKYFLLSMLVPFANCICLFLCRNQGYSNFPANPYVQQMQYPQNNQY